MFLLRYTSLLLYYINLTFSTFQLRSLKKSLKISASFPQNVFTIIRIKNKVKKRLHITVITNGSPISKKVVKVCELTVLRIGSSTGTIWPLFPWQRLLHQSIRFLPASRYPAPQPLPSKYSTRCTATRFHSATATAISSTTLLA